MINQEAAEVVVVVDQDQKSKGSRGTVGEPTASLTIKQMWRAAHFKLVDANKSKSNKRIWVKNKNAPSLKQFARSLLAKADATATLWFEHKEGSTNQERSEKNVQRAALEASATKSSRKKNKSEGKAKKDAAAPATPKKP